jgi:hypothetical protein
MEGGRTLTKADDGLLRARQAESEYVLHYHHERDHQGLGSVIFVSQAEFSVIHSAAEDTR